MIPVTLHSASAEDTLRAGERLGRRLASAEYPQGVVVLLVGPLGAGKTVLAQGVARGAGVKDPVISPTYTIIAEYAAPRGSFHHVDLYRVEGKDQIENLGLDDIMRGNGIVLIEWGEKLAAAMGAGPEGDVIRVTLSFAEDGGRDITIEEDRP